MFVRKSSPLTNMGLVKRAQAPNLLAMNVSLEQFITLINIIKVFRDEIFHILDGVKLSNNVRPYNFLLFVVSFSDPVIFDGKC